MTKISTITSLLSILFCSAQAQVCTQTATGNNIDVLSGQVVCVETNISNANVNIAAGGSLKVAAGSTLSIQNFNNFNGTLINNGTLVLGNANFGTGGKLVNNNQVTFNGTPNFNGTGNITNTTNATITFNATMSLGNASTLNNSGTMIFQNGDLSANSGTTLVNSGRLEVRNGNFNPSGSVTNEGFFLVNNFINLNGGDVLNNCRFVVGQGFNNAAAFINNGLVWVTNTSTGKIQNNGGGTWMNGKKGLLRGHDFINGGTVSGAGDFYFTGDTRQQGSFEGSYGSADSAIRFYDVSNTPTTTGSFFDFGIQGAHVTRPATMIPADTTAFYGFCANQTFRPETPLPLNLLRFEATTRDQDVLLQWETAKETGTKLFEIEYSTDGSNWHTVGSVTALGREDRNSYQFTHYDALAMINLYRLKMVDIDGQFTYSPVKTVNRKNLAGVITTYPNPFAGLLQLSGNGLPESMTVTIRITDVRGNTFINETAKLEKGNNSLTLHTETLPAGIYLVVVKNNNNGEVLGRHKVIKK